MVLSTLPVCGDSSAVESSTTLTTTSWGVFQFPAVNVSGTAGTLVWPSLTTGVTTTSATGCVSSTTEYDTVVSAWASSSVSEPATIDTPVTSLSVTGPETT